MIKAEKYFSYRLSLIPIVDGENVALVAKAVKAEKRAKQHEIS